MVLVDITMQWQPCVCFVIDFVRISKWQIIGRIQNIVIVYSNASIKKQQQRPGKQQQQPLHDVAMDLIDIIVKLQPRTACIMVFVDTSMWHVRSSISDNLGQNIWDTWWKYRKTPPPTLNVGLGLSRLPVTHLVLFNITQHWEWGRGGSSEPLFTSFFIKSQVSQYILSKIVWV